MNSFFLEIPSTPSHPAINYQNITVMMGSCFVENMHQKMAFLKIPNLCNPFGITFHPQAIYQLIKRIETKEKFTEDAVFYHNEQWHCFEVHSCCSHKDKNVLLKQLNNSLENTYKAIKNASHFILTFGSAWGYYYQNDVVANCHKVPQKEFTKQLSSVQELTATFDELFETLKAINPKITVINTVSPVRHIKDGIIENNQSKAHLIAALHTSISKHENIHYYPAYELLMDCLRDYRFYKSDLIHPNETAVDYVWNHFTETWLHEPLTNEIAKKVTEITKAENHRSFNPESEAHQKFLQNLQTKKRAFKAQYPFVNL